MHNLQKEQVQRAIPAFCNVKEISGNDLAVMVGVSSSVISNMKNGNWDNISNALFKRVWQYINPDAMEGIFQTNDCKSVFDLCNNAVKNKRMIGLTGDTGLGKTTALKAYGIRPNVFYVYIDSTVTPVVFLQGLLKQMGRSNHNYGVHDMLNTVIMELCSVNEPLLIIDEAGKLKDKLILMLHTIRDMTKTNAGIVLAGMPGFKNGLISKVNRGVTGYSEFFRRINIWHELSGLSSQEITFVLDNNGITDKETQREFRRYTRFGDLDNAINNHKLLNAVNN